MFALPIMTLSTIAAASALVTGLFGLNVQSAYQFMKPFATAALTTGANQSEGFTSVKLFHPQAVLNHANLKVIANNSALVILEFGRK
jgi:cobalamin biosynthesis protein CbiG